MPAGLELYRDGEATPYFSTEGGWIYGSTAVSLAAGGSSSVTDANLALGTPFYFVVSSNNAFNCLDVSISGTTINYSSTDGFTGRLFYGVKP